MARRIPENPTAHTLEEIEHFGDRVVETVSQNPIPVVTVLGAILLTAALWSGVSYYQGSRDRAALVALEDVRTAYVTSMGGTLMSVKIPEPANPETARSIRLEHAALYEGVAEEHAGRTAGVLALLEAGQLRLEVGEAEVALELWMRAAAASDGSLRGLVLERIGQLHEAEDRPTEAAQVYAEAGDIAGYPLRYEALGSAARAWADAGNSEQAVALYKRIQAESPDTSLAPYVESRLRELEAAQR